MSGVKNDFLTFIIHHLFRITQRFRLLLGQVKKKDVSRPDFYKKKGQAGGFFYYLLFPIACFLYIITFPQGYVGTLRSNINKKKH